MFVSLSDFHLQNNSLCKDAGNPNTQIIQNEKDFYNNDRIFNVRIDIGASEYTSASGIEDTNSNQNVFIKIYPNPTKTFVNIDLDNKYSNANLTVYNILGEEMISQKLNEATTVDLFELTNGVYFLKIYNDNKIMTVNKIIIHK